MVVVGSANAQEMKSILETRVYGEPTLAPPREPVKADEPKVAADEPKAEVSEPRAEVTESIVEKSEPVKTALSQVSPIVVASPQVCYIYVYVPAPKAVPAKSKRELRRSQVPVVPVNWVLLGRHK